MKRLSFFFVALALAMVSSCEPVDPFAIGLRQLALDQSLNNGATNATIDENSLMLASDAGSTVLKFKANAKWTAMTAAVPTSYDTKALSWMTIDPTSGKAGLVEMTVKVTENDDEEVRSGYIIISTASSVGKVYRDTITVTQLPCDTDPIEFPEEVFDGEEYEPITLFVDFIESEITVPFTANAAWTAEPHNCDWLSIEDGQGDAGDVELVVKMTANHSEIERQGAIVLKSLGKEYKINFVQDQKAPSTIAYGLWTNDFTCNYTSEYPMALHFSPQGNAIIEYDEFAEEADKIVISSTPFDFNYDAETGCGTIMTRGNSAIKSMEFYFSYGSIIADLEFNRETTIDSMQVFRFDPDLEEFIKQQESVEEEYSVENPLYIGPSDEKFVDTDADLDVPNEFYGDEAETKAVGAVLLTAGQWLGEKLAGACASYAGTALMNLIFKSEDPNVKTFKKILDNTEQIKNKLNTLEGKLDKIIFNQFAAKVAQRNKIILGIHTVNHECMLDMDKIYNNKAYEQDTVTRDSLILVALNKWASTPQVEFTGATFLSQLTNFLMETTSNYNMFQVYDLYVFNTHRWEAEGYSDREDFRDGDVAIVAECLFLTALRHKLRNEPAEVAKDIKIAQNFAQFYAKNPVKRRNDVAVCQIKDAHVIFKKAPEKVDYQGMPYLKDQVLFTTGETLRADERRINTIPKSELNYDTDLIFYNRKPATFILGSEAKAIVNVYGNKMSLNQIFSKTAGFAESSFPNQRIVTSEWKFSFDDPGSYIRRSHSYFKTLKSCNISMGVYDNGPNSTVVTVGKMSLGYYEKTIKKKFSHTTTRYYRFDRWSSYNSGVTWVNYPVVTRYKDYDPRNPQ